MIIGYGVRWGESSIQALAAGSRAKVLEVEDGTINDHQQYRNLIHYSVAMTVKRFMMANVFAIAVG